MNATPPIDIDQVSRDYRCRGVVRIREFFSRQQVAAVRAELERYVRDDLPGNPADAATFEADETTIRNLWRLEKYCPALRSMVASPDIQQLVASLVNGEPVLCGIETFNKPARIGSGVPWHQDNSYFCRTPADMLTIWIAIDAVTEANGPVYYLEGSHTQGVLPTRLSGVRGNSIGLAEIPDIPAGEQFCGLLNPGDATIHHCNTIHHSAPNTTDQSRLGFLLVFRGAHTKVDPVLKAAYDKAVTATPPA